VLAKLLPLPLPSSGDGDGDAAGWGGGGAVTRRSGREWRGVDSPGRALRASGQDGGEGGDGTAWRRQASEGELRMRRGGGAFFSFFGR